MVTRSGDIAKSDIDVLVTLLRESRSTKNVKEMAGTFGLGALTGVGGTVLVDQIIHAVKRKKDEQRASPEDVIRRLI